MREMTVYGVSFDMVGRQPIVLLKTADGSQFLPIWIGHAEAAAILMKLQGSTPVRPHARPAQQHPRPAGAEVVRITVTELRDSTFYASITLRQNGQELEIDSRPSDAIALAVRVRGEDLRHDEVIEESAIEFEGDDERTSAGSPASPGSRISIRTSSATSWTALPPRTSRRQRARTSPKRATSPRAPLQLGLDGHREDQRGRVEEHVHHHARVDAARAPAQVAGDEAERHEWKQPDHEPVRKAEQHRGADQSAVAPATPARAQ